MVSKNESADTRSQQPLRRVNKDGLRLRCEKEQYPELDSMLTERWKELRKNIFTEENIFAKVDAYTAEITDSGALNRDYNYLGWNSWGGDDTMENFKVYIQRRLEILDQMY